MPRHERYRPVPIDTRGVVLPEGVERLAETLARNTHEVWARERLADGWRYGPRRDDTRKEHPGLVSYDELPADERRYDEIVVLETLKALRAAGFDIVPPPRKRGRP